MYHPLLGPKVCGPYDAGTSIVFVTELGLLQGAKDTEIRPVVMVGVGVGVLVGVIVGVGVGVGVIPLIQDVQPVYWLRPKLLIRFNVLTPLQVNIGKVPNPVPATFQQFPKVSVTTYEYHVDGAPVVTGKYCDGRYISFVTRPSGSEHGTKASNTNPVVSVGVGVGVRVAVGDGEAPGVNEGVIVGVIVGVTVGVFVGVKVGVFVGVCVGVFVGVFVGVCVGVGVTVGVTVLVGVIVGVSVTGIVVVVVVVGAGIGSTIQHGKSIT